MSVTAKITTPLLTSPPVTTSLGKEFTMRIHNLVAAILLVSVVGCGGSSGGSTGAGGVTAMPGVQGQMLGSRSVPGGTITVSTDGPVQPSAAKVFHLALSAGMPVPTGVRAWIGIAYDPMAEGIQATPVATVPGSYDVTVTVPSLVAAGSHVWVRLSFADGSVVETGSEDFPLAGH